MDEQYVNKQHIQLLFNIRNKNTQQPNTLFVPVFDSSKGGSGASGCLGVRYQVLSNMSIEHDTMKLQSLLIARLKIR